MDRQRYILVVMPKRKFVGLVGEIPAGFEYRFKFAVREEYPNARRLVSGALLVISHSYFCPKTNFFILQARARGITTAFLVDGPLEWSNSYLPRRRRTRHLSPNTHLMEPLLHDAVLAVSSAQAGYLAFKNSNESILAMTYANQRVIGEAVPSGDTRWQFLITTAKKPYFNEQEKSDLIMLIERLVHVLEHGGYSYVLRIFDPGLTKTLPAHAQNLPEGRFEDVLKQVECVIGTPSSVLLQSMASDRPTGTLIYRDSPLFYQTGWLLGNLENLEKTLESMIAREKTRMDFQTFSVKQNLSQDDLYAILPTVVSHRTTQTPKPENYEALCFENSTLKSLLESPQNISLGYWFYRLQKLLLPKR